MGVGKGQVHAETRAHPVDVDAGARVDVALACPHHSHVARERGWVRARLRSRTALGCHGRSTAAAPLCTALTCKVAPHPGTGMQRAVCPATIAGRFQLHSHISQGARGGKGERVSLEGRLQHLHSAEREHVPRAGRRVARADGVQEGDEVRAHARRQLLRQPKVQQDLRKQRGSCQVRHGPRSACTLCSLCHHTRPPQALQRHQHATEGFPPGAPGVAPDPTSRP